LTDRIRVALCDDHPILRSGLRRLLEAEADVEVVGEARSAQEVVTLARTTTPDVLIVDIGLPGGSGIDATRRILESSPGSKVLVLTMHQDVEYVRAAFEAGAAGYLIKEAAESELLQAVRTVAEGRRYVYPTVAGALFAESRTAARPATYPGGQLTERERAVLRLLALGHTNVETAAELHLSVRTVETHRAHIQHKLGVKSRAALARAAREAGLLDT
jgi:DNA-binding NarL/FixJ family response regulator